jgi:hypothetical protein
LDRSASRARPRPMEHPTTRSREARCANATTMANLLRQQIESGNSAPSLDSSLRELRVKRPKEQPAPATLEP